MSAPALSRATACPSWCSEHLEDSDPNPVHVHTVTVGNVSVMCEWAPGDPNSDGAPVVYLGEYLSVWGQNARDYAAAIVQACDILDSASTEDVTTAAR